MIAWSEQREPCEECRYTHVVSETPLGKLYIEWKGWKDCSSPTCHMFDGTFVLANDLADAKELVQAAWDKMAADVARLATAYEQKAVEK
jgi:hypothetical protein